MNACTFHELVEKAEMRKADCRCGELATLICMNCDHVCCDVCALPSTFGKFKEKAA